MFYTGNKLANSLSNSKWQGSMESQFKSLAILSPTARWQSLSEEPCVTLGTDCCLTRSIHSWAHPWRLEEEWNLTKPFVIWLYQSFPSILRVFWSRVDSHLWRGVRSWESFMGSKKYLKIHSGYIISCNLGFCSWQTCYESERADPTHFFVIKTSQIWPWLLSVSLFDQCNGEVRIATLKICQSIPRGWWRWWWESHRQWWDEDKFSHNMVGEWNTEWDQWSRLQPTCSTADIYWASAVCRMLCEVLERQDGVDIAAVPQKAAVEQVTRRVVRWAVMDLGALWSLKSSMYSLLENHLHWVLHLWHLTLKNHIQRECGCFYCWRNGPWCLWEALLLNIALNFVLLAQKAHGWNLSRTKLQL